MLEIKRQTITGTLQGIETKDARGGEAITYKVVRAGMKFPDYITRWPPRENEEDTPAPQLTNGRIYEFLVDAKPKDESGLRHWYNFVAVKSPSESPSEAPQGATEPARATQPAGQVVRGAEDPTPARIARSVALKAAVDMAVGGLLPTLRVSSLSDHEGAAEDREEAAQVVIDAAGIFYDFLKSDDPDHVEEAPGPMRRRVNKADDGVLLAPDAGLVDPDEEAYEGSPFDGAGI
jgi:hypothetical protein